MDVPEEKLAAISGVEDDEEEEIEEEEVEEEIEEEVEEEEEEGEGKGRGIGDNVDSAAEEMKQAANGNGSSSSSSKPGKIFVGGVAWETTEESFSNHFVKYGKITDSVIMKDKHTQMPRGFGFVTFADPSVIDEVLEDEHVIDGRAVEVKRTVPREDMSSKGVPKTKKIFVGGIPTSFSEDELKEHFGSYGKVIEHQIMLDHSSGRSRGFGFVTFESEETVEKIISEGKMHDLGGKQVEIKKAEPKKGGGDAAFSSSRAGFGAGGGNFHGFGGGGYRSDSDYYGGRAGGGYGRGYGYGYGAGASYGWGFGQGFAGPMYGAGGYGAGDGYGAPGSYGGGYSGYGGGGGGGGGRGYGSRYHPYGR